MSNINPEFPLTGKTILVTRAAGQSSEFCQLLQQQGAVVIEMPALEITPPSSWFALDEAIANLHTFNWLILTSTNGVDYFFSRLQDKGKNVSALAGVKIAVVGKKTAASLEQYGLFPNFIPPNFVADSLVEHFPEQLLNQKILFPRVETGGREVLVQELTAKGAQVVEVSAYQSGCPSSIAPEALQALQQQTVDIITFASSKTVQYFYQLVKDNLPLDKLQKVSIASIGPQTSKTCQQLLGRVDVEATEYTLGGLTEAIVNSVLNKQIIAEKSKANYY
ncbi:MAG TPA: uroporphyrinogen-III synthase [Phormidium sp.]